MFKRFNQLQNPRVGNNYTPGKPKRPPFRLPSNFGFGSARDVSSLPEMPPEVWLPSGPRLGTVVPRDPNQPAPINQFGGTVVPRDYAGPRPIDSRFRPRPRPRPVFGNTPISPEEIQQFTRTPIGMAAGDVVSSGLRSGSTGPNVQRNIPGRMKNVGQGVMGRNIPGRTQILSRMGGLGRMGGAGLIAAGAYGLYELGKQVGFEPENLGSAAARANKGLQEVIDEAVEVATTISAPVTEYVNRIINAYQTEMQISTDSSQSKYPPIIDEESGITLSDLDEQNLDAIGLNVDARGRTLSDLDKRLEFAEGGEVPRETIEIAAQTGVPTDEVQQALSQLEAVEPEMNQLNEMVTMVMQMIQSGASEEEVIMALQQMGLDEEDIQAIFEMIMAQVQNQEMQIQDPIQNELAQMG